MVAFLARGLREPNAAPRLVSGATPPTMDSQSSVGAGSDIGTPHMDTESGSFANDATSMVPMAPETGSEPTTTSRARPQAMPKMDEIPVVTDETGERVRESFASFLERYVETINIQGSRSMKWLADSPSMSNSFMSCATIVARRSTWTIGMYFNTTRFLLVQLVSNTTASFPISGEH